MGRIAIGYNDIGCHCSSVIKGHALSDTILDIDGRYRGPQLDFDELSLHELAKGFGYRSSPTHGEMNTMCTFEKVDQAINAGRVEWIAAEKQRLNRKCLPQLGVGHITRH